MDLSEYIHHEIQRHLAHKAFGVKVAEVSSYDSKRHAIKALLKPDGIETGWFPVNTPHVGNGIGMVVGPNVGDQITVGFIDGNINNPVHMGRLHSDKEQPPEVKSGEIIISVSGGKQLKITSSGFEATGNWDFKGGYVKVNGHAIDDTHVHVDTMPGSGTSGKPQ